MKKVILKQIFLFLLFSCSCLSLSGINVVLANTKLEEILLSTKTTQRDKVQMLYQEMLESLEEAILVVKGNKIEF